MPGCTVVFFGFASLGFISFVTELFKCFDRLPGQARNTVLRKIIYSFYRTVIKQWYIFRKSWSLHRAIGIKFSTLRNFYLWRLSLISFIYYQLATCLELIGSDSEERKLQKRNCFVSCDLVNNMIMTSSVAFSSIFNLFEGVLFALGVCVKSCNTGDSRVILNLLTTVQRAKHQSSDHQKHVIHGDFWKLGRIRDQDYVWQCGSGKQNVQQL